MALVYTGSADVLEINGKRYAKPSLYDKNPDSYDGSLAKPIPNFTEKDALGLLNKSNYKTHSFSTVKGEDLLEVATTPTPAAQSKGDK